MVAKDKYLSNLGWALQSFAEAVEASATFHRAPHIGIYMYISDSDTCKPKWDLSLNR